MITNLPFKIYTLQLDIHLFIQKLFSITMVLNKTYSLPLRIIYSNKQFFLFLKREQKEIT